MNKTTKIIVLNGTSSSGKTTIARELQSKSSEVYLLCSLDVFWNMAPCKIPAGSTNFPNLKLALVKSVKALAQTGHNVIVDIFFSGQKTYDEFKNELQGLETKIIRIDCPIEELNARELARGDRKPGLAASQIDSIHKGVLYDLIIDTSTSSPSKCAQTILKDLH